MKRRPGSASTAAFLLAASFAGGLLAQDATSPAPPRRLRTAAGGARDTVVTLQAEVEERYLRLQALMAKLLQAIDRQEETGRVASALERSQELQVVERLRGIQELLSGRSYSEALEEEKVAEKDLERILRILRGLDEAEEAKKDREELEEMREALERLQRLGQEEAALLEETKALDEEGRSPDDPEEKEKSSLLAKKQRDTGRKTDDLRRGLERREGEKEEDARSREGEAKEGGVQGQGQEGGKEGGQEGGKQGGGKQGGKQGGQKAAAKKGQQGGQQAGEQAGEQKSEPGQQARGSSRSRSAQALRRASQRMEGASRRLEARNLTGAEEDEKEALAELQRAREEMEEAVEEKEEENAEEMARRVITVLQAMLAEQELVSRETKTLDAEGKTPPDAAAAGENAAGDAAPARPEEGADAAESPATAGSLARRERSLRTDAEDAIRIIEAARSSVAAPAILERVGDDLENAAGLLDASETGEPTQIVQADIERSLRELIAALTPPPRAPRAGESAKARPRRGRPRDLITPAMEIKILRGAQKRLRERTERLAGLGLLDREGSVKTDAAAGEPADVAKREELLRDQAGEVARAEEALAELMKALIAKYPVIDLALLGAQNEAGEEELKIPLIRGPPEGEGEADGGRNGSEKDGSKTEDDPGPERESAGPDREERKE